jgi:hypothetical protein
VDINFDLSDLVIEGLTVTSLRDGVALPETGASATSSSWWASSCCCCTEPQIQ